MVSQRQGNQWWVWLLIGAVLVVLLVLLVPFPLAGDFIAYWSGSALMARGENAYDPEALHLLQRSTGRGYDVPINVWNPPWTLILLLPFGVLPFAWARALWLMSSVALLAVSGYWLGRVYWPDLGRWGRLVSATLPLLVVNAWVALAQGQINILVPLGIAGALFWFTRSPILSGMLIVLATVKPQICIGALLLFGLRALVERQWRFIAGAVGAWSVLLLILTLLRPVWITDYQRVLQTPLLDYRTPTVATWVREQWPSLPVSVLALVLSAFVLLLLAAWTVRTRKWEMGIASAIVITMFFTVFNWSYDQIVLLIPAYLLLGQARTSRALYLSVSAALLFLNLLTLGIRVTGSTDDFHFVWVVPAFAFLYLLVLAGAPAIRKGEPLSEVGGANRR